MKKPTGEWREVEGKWYKKVVRTRWQRYFEITCLQCGNHFLTKHIDSTTCSKKCMANFRWKNIPKDERVKNKTRIHAGYVEIYVPENEMSDNSGWMGEHRYVMGKHLSRKLDRSELVHHIDGNKQNNDISNLIILGKAEHTSNHKRKDAESRKRSPEGKFI